MDMHQAAPRALHETNQDRFASIEEFLVMAERRPDCPATAEWLSALTLAWSALDELRDSYGLPAHPDPLAYLNLPVQTVTVQSALSAVRSAATVLRREGLVLNVHQRPLKPLAMGHYETVISAFAGRGVVA